MTSSKESLASKYVWAETVEKYLEEAENSWYTQPNNVVGVLVDTKTGKIATDESSKKSILYCI